MVARSTTSQHFPPMVNMAPHPHSYNVTSVHACMQYIRIQMWKYRWMHQIYILAFLVIVFVYTYSPCHCSIQHVHTLIFTMCKASKCSHCFPDQFHIWLYITNQVHQPENERQSVKLYCSRAVHLKAQSYVFARHQCTGYVPIETHCICEAHIKLSHWFYMGWLWEWRALKC